MHLGTYVDGRTLTYDENTGAFAVGDAPVTIDQVRAYETAGDIQWASYDTREWFENAFYPVSAATTASGRAAGRAAGVVVGVAAGLMLLSCACFTIVMLVAAPSGDGSGSTNGAPAGATSTAGTSEALQPAAESSPAASLLSLESLVHARTLGGTGHVGQELYLVIGASVETEKEARVRLDEATASFGDMQSYFIVQKSDSFQGLKPGRWIVAEAYRAEPSPENLQFAGRAFPDAYVEKVVVRTADPIPVYEEMLEAVQ